MAGRSLDDHGVTTRKYSECTTSWTKHERAARWYVRCTLDGCRSGGGRRHVCDGMRLAAASHIDRGSKVSAAKRARGQRYKNECRVKRDICDARRYSSLCRRCRRRSPDPQAATAGGVGVSARFETIPPSDSAQVLS